MTLSRAAAKASTGSRTPDQCAAHADGIDDARGDEGGDRRRAADRHHRHGVVRTPAIELCKDLLAGQDEAHHRCEQERARHAVKEGAAVGEDNGKALRHAFEAKRPAIGRRERLTEPKPGPDCEHHRYRRDYDEDQLPGAREQHELANGRHDDGNEQEDCKNQRHDLGHRLPGIEVAHAGGERHTDAGAGDALQEAEGEEQGEGR